MEFFIPKELIKAKNEVILIHTRKSYFDPNSDNDSFFKFLKLLEKKNKIKAVEYAKTEMLFLKKLCYYILTNSNNHENYFWVLLNLADEEDWEKIFIGWQDHFRNDEVRKFIADAQHKSEAFKKYKDSNLPDADLDWMKNDDVVDNICKICGKVASEKAFARNMVSLGIICQKELYVNCLKRFLLYCNRQAYLSFDDNLIIRAYNGFEDNDKIRFLINYIGELDMSDLDIKESIYETVTRSLTSDVSRKKLTNALSDCGLLSKYNQWLDRMKLKLFFNGDPYRFHFWIMYQKGNKIMDYGNTLYIDFGEYVATEFKEVSGGPFYLFTKSYFDNVIWNKMRSMKSKQAFQSYLRSLYDKNASGLLVRLTHYPKCGGWTSKFAYTLRNYGILPSE